MKNDYTLMTVAKNISISHATLTRSSMVACGVHAHSPARTCRVPACMTGHDGCTSWNERGK
jgi:hypothetical protein